MIFSLLVLLLFYVVIPVLIIRAIIKYIKDRKKKKKEQYIEQKAHQHFCVKEGVKVFNEGCFKNYDNEGIIDLPSTLEQIDASAFKGHLGGSNNISMQEYVRCINFDKSKVETIPFGLFSGFKRLESITIPEGVKRIEASAFYDCCSLRRVILPSTLEEIGGGLFTRCYNLESVDFSKVSLLKEIPSNAFEDCRGLKSITLPKGVERIKHAAFMNCMGIEVIFPCTLKKIEGHPFENLSFNHDEIDTLIEKHRNNCSGFKFSLGNGEWVFQVL